MVFWEFSDDKARMPYFDAMRPDAENSKLISAIRHELRRRNKARRGTAGKLIHVIENLIEAVA